MKKGLFLFSIFIILITLTLSAAPVSFQLAEQTAKFKLAIENKDDFIVEDYFTLTNDNGEILGYVFHLDPQGFIIVSSDTDIVPILGYSFLNNYIEVENDDEWTIGHHFVTLDLDLRKKGIPYTSSDILAKNNMLWDKYEQKDLSYFVQQTKGRDIYPPSGSTSTGGWLEALWDQGYPWNMYCPIDPQHGGRCVVGCVATAMGMIVDYHRYVDDATFSDADDYVSDNTWPHIYIDNDHITLDFPSFPELNVLLDQVRMYYQTNLPLPNSLKAAVSFACGVAVEMQYSYNASGAYCSDVRNALLNKFDFDTASHYYSSHPNFYPQIQNDMMAARPCEIGITGAGGHAINVDGWNSGEDTYHLNFGWAGSYNGWYTLPSGMPAGFTSVDNGVLNIQGGIYPFLEIDEVFTSELSGDGDGQVNPGETASIRVRLSNRQSFSTATTVVATLETADPRATVTDPTGTYNDIPPGSSQLNLLDPFTVEFDEGIGVCTIPFTLHVTSNDGYYADLEFDIDVTLNLAGWPVLITNGVPGSPAIADINNTKNDMELACGDKNGELHFYGMDGIEKSGFPYNTGNQIYGSVAVSNLDADAELEIVAASRANKILALNPDGSVLFDYATDSNLLCTPVITDLDGDGIKEIIGQTITRNLYVINQNGGAYPNFPIQLPNFMYSAVGVAVEDLNGDNVKEILVACNDGILYCINASGSTDWTATLSGAPHCSPTIVKFNDTIKIVIGDAAGIISILDVDGNIEAEYPLSGDIRTSPVVINPDNSANMNDLVIIAGTMNNKLYALDWLGNDLPGFPYDVTGGIESTPAVADLDGNGLYDIVFGCNDKYLYSVDMQGDPTIEFPIYFDYDIKSSPQISDVDGDGDYDIAVGTNAGMWIIDYKTPYGDSDMLVGIYRYNLERTGVVDCSPVTSAGNDPQHYTYYLAQNFPNPVKDNTKISFGLPNTHAQNPKIKVYNLLGQLVSSYDIQNAQPGENIFEWNGRDDAEKDIPNGVYFYRLETDSYKSEIKKLILLK
ncbi:MAG TPA: T9SS type A sorting domain-containing protein [Candidatus Cloacimonetes bacterium]|nr:T9SS type A sorting domain-containing protein [Candidatus Cloacimonadota bacterium]HEX38075.1 T9SS type A sorting domain-containing protein [Candidatus Cloacimonadota bacterium]